MSVVPFVLEGPNRTVVDTNSQFTAAGGLEGKVLLIMELDKSQFDPAGKNSNASYDLRVGSEYRDHRETGRRDLTDSGSIRLFPGMAVVIETLEEVHLPRSSFGLIVPKVSLGQDGLTITASKIDPGYRGRLLVTAYNIGKKTVELRRREPLCSLYVLRVLDGSRPYEKPAKKLHGEATDNAWRKARYWLEANTGLWIVILTVATLLLTAAQIYVLIETSRRPPAEGRAPTVGLVRQDGPSSS